MKSILLCAENGNPALVEVVRVLLGGDVKVNSEDKVSASEVEVHWQSYLQQKIWDSEI